MNETPPRPQPTPGSAAGPSPNPRIAGLLLVLVVVELTVATAYIHLTLGGLLFTINGLGYLVLATVYAVVAVVPVHVFGPFAWLSRLALAGYALLTIAAYVVIGPYFALGWIAKGIEAAIVGLVIVDLLETFGDPVGRLQAALSQNLPRPD